jgi:hypothetical protein
MSMPALDPTLAPGLEPAPALAAVRTARRLLDALADSTMGMERDQIAGQLWALRKLELELQRRLHASWGIAPPGGDAA